ncbi:MAG TPA: hypothetical protein VGT02_05030 [Methylomirabilota bacterium]|nr:hypothetical protein [Methylomirabilota bacterium]
MTRRVASILAVLLLSVAAVEAAPAEDRLLALDRYTSDKGRTLGATYVATLKQINASIYHCMPWLEVPKEGLGFYKPRDASRDDRYLSLRVYIEQEPSTQFTAMPVEQRASSMFSRYVGPLLRRLAGNRAMLADNSLDGFTVILEWLKQIPLAGGRPVHETIAVFLDKPTALEYLQGMVKAPDLAERARVYGWDGETPLGRLRLASWDDNFVSTYKVENYQLAAGVTCQ